MSEHDHEWQREALSAYLLGALEPGEAAGLEQHLAGCEECRAELTWLRPAAQVLPESVERRERRLCGQPSVSPLIAAGVAAYAIRDGDSGSGATIVVAGKAPGVTAEMVREGDSGTLRLANVRRLRADQVLQAWVRRGERIEPAEASLFVPNRNGAATAVIDGMQGVNAVMVTAAPRAGSDLPTPDPLISVPVRQ